MTRATIWNRISPKRLFLIDGLGALLTAALLGLVLAPMEGVFGMPAKVLYPLALIALAFAVYSFTCHLRIGDRWRPYLRAIAIANLAYCGLTLGLVGYYHASLKFWGFLYFAGEILIVVALSTIELRAAGK